MQGISFTRVKRGIKSTFSVLLCIALIVAMSYRKPVKTEAAITTTTVAITGIVAVAAALSTLGIMASANHKTYAQECGDIWNNITTDVKNQITLTGLSVHEGLATLALTPAFLKAVFTGAQTEFPQAVTGTTIQSASNISLSNWLTKFVGKTVPINSGFDSTNWTKYSIVGTITIPVSAANVLTDSTFTIPPLTFPIESTGLVNKFSSSISATTWGIKTMPTNYLYRILTNEINSYGQNWFSFPSGSSWIAFTGYTASNYLTLFLANYDICPQSMMFMEWADDGTAPVIPVYGQDVFNPADKDLYADGDSSMTKSIDVVLADLLKKLGISDGTIPVTVPSDSDIDRQQTRDQTDTTGKDIASDADKTADKTYNNDRDTTVPKSDDTPDLSIPDLMYNKFPFCLPWDMYNSIKVLVATPTPPKFTVPFLKISAWNIDQSVTIDTSQFSSVATTTRWGFSVLWILGLIFATRKLIWK